MEIYLDTISLSAKALLFNDTKLHDSQRKVSLFFKIAESRPAWLSD